MMVKDKDLYDRSSWCWTDRVFPILLSVYHQTKQYTVIPILRFDFNYNYTTPRLNEKLIRITQIF